MKKKTTVFKNEATSPENYLSIFERLRADEPPPNIFGRAGRWIRFYGKAVQD